MENILTLKNTLAKYRSAVIDLLGLTVVYFTPAIAHLFSYPVYYLEPMRIFLVLSIVHTTKKNAYFLALTLPLFSFLVSAHPSLVKAALISGELLLNVFLFYLIFYRSGKVWAAIGGSIILSKISYYIFKYVLLTGGILTGSLISTPLLIQTVMVVVFSVYAIFLFKSELDRDQ